MIESKRVDNMVKIPYYIDEGVAMLNFTVQFFEKDDGSCPVEDFLDSLDDKMAAKAYGMIELLEEYGNELRMPYSEQLEDGIFELRIKFGGNITRILYFFFVRKNIILTNGFMKKTQKTPPNEIAKAKQYRTIYLTRQERKP